jgi:transcriptional regulator GlxA family with amidase domain
MIIALALAATATACVVAGIRIIRDATPWADTPAVRAACRRELRRGRRLIVLALGIFVLALGAASLGAPL